MKFIGWTILVLVILASCGSSAEKSDKLVEEGVVLLYQSRFEEASELFLEAIDINPQNFEAYYYHGNCLANNREYRKAIDDFTKAIEINKNYAEAYANRGYMKSYLQDKEGACDDWKIAESLGMESMSDLTRHCD
jgi:tetratricopeptide (TPR) repeat protein